MKISLFTPPAARIMNPMSLEADLKPSKTWVPLGIAYLATSLRAGGFDVELKDLHDYEWNQVERLISDISPDVIGISCFTFGRIEALKVAALAKRINPDITVVMGGPHATFFPEQILMNEGVDIVVLGEGEVTIVELAGCLAEKRNLDQIKGIAYKKNGQIYQTLPRSRVKSLDELKFPAYDAFDINEYNSPEIPPQYSDLPGTHVITSRGCPFQCKFCSVHHFFGGKWAFRSPENVVDEVETLIHTLGVRHIYFSDDLFTLNHDRTIAICHEILNRRLNFVWMAETRVDCVNEEMLSWMRKAGCYRIYYGVESGSPKILKSINKGFTVNQVQTAFKITHEAGIEPCCFLMVGNPGENPETISETINLILEIRPTTLPIIGITTILPGTDQYKLSKKQGLITDEYWLSDSPPPLYTGEYPIDDLIYLQMLLTKGICPELYAYLCEMGFDENYFRMRKMNSLLSD